MIDRNLLNRMSQAIQAVESVKEGEGVLNQLIDKIEKSDSAKAHRIKADIARIQAKAEKGEDVTTEIQKKWR